jgi:hypothetical protein
MFEWKISTDSLCNVCKVEEHYDHCFMSCKYLDMFWNTINKMFEKKKLKTMLRLQHLVFGYTIFVKEYFHVNHF